MFFRLLNKKKRKKKGRGEEENRDIFQVKEKHIFPLKGEKRGRFRDLVYSPSRGKGGKKGGEASSSSWLKGRTSATRGYRKKSVIFPFFSMRGREKKEKKKGDL